MSLDQQPIEEPIDNMRADEREHHRPHMSHSLQITAECTIQQERQGTEAESSHKCSGQPANFRIDAECIKHRRHKGKHRHQRNCNEQRQVDALGERMMAVAPVPCPESHHSLSQGVYLALFITVPLMAVFALM